MKQTFLKFERERKTLYCQGEWVILNINEIKKAAKAILHTLNEAISIDGKAISKMDSAGALIIANIENELTMKHHEVSLVHFETKHHELITLVKGQLAKMGQLTPINTLSPIQTIGKESITQVNETNDFLNFIGKTALAFIDQLKNPGQWRFNSIMQVINVTGVSALPIIALLSFMIGVVISYQMGNQLKNYGANIFIVNLLGLSVLREFGPLITAIMVAGRTGSAFTAELGIMKINQEIDFLNTMGINTEGLLIIPRLIGLFIVMPLLTMWADIFGVIGGMLMAQNLLNVTWVDFLTRFQTEIPLKALIIGLLKAPLFALIIASIGCFQGMKVAGSAESVGARTTKSVVLAIFFIVVVDALLSVLLSKYKI